MANRAVLSLLSRLCLQFFRRVVNVSSGRMRDRNAPLSYKRVYESKYVEESQTRWTIAFNMSKEETTTTT